MRWDIEWPAWFAVILFVGPSFRQRYNVSVTLICTFNISNVLFSFSPLNEFISFFSDKKEKQPKKKCVISSEARTHEHLQLLVWNCTVCIATRSWYTTYTGLLTATPSILLTNQIAQQGMWIFNWIKPITWLWRWLPQRSSKCQSPATVLLSTPVTRWSFSFKVCYSWAQPIFLETFLTWPVQYVCSSFFLIFAPIYIN